MEYCLARFTSSTAEQEIPISGIRYGRRSGRYLCGADSENYNMVDLLENSSLPLLPFNQAQDGSKTRPSIFPVSDEEFLMLSNMGVSAMGVFITSGGDPVRGTLEWEAYPLSICEFQMIVGMNFRLTCMSQALITLMSQHFYLTRPYKSIPSKPKPLFRQSPCHMEQPQTPSSLLTMDTSFPLPKG